MTPEIKALFSSASWWEYAGYVASLLVLFGVALEAVDLYNKARNGQWREHLIEVIAFLILMSGLSLEILTQVQSNNRNSLIVGFLNDEAGKAFERAGKAEQRAAEASLALEQLKAPRLLSDAAQKSISESLKPFAGTMFTGTVAQGVADAWPLWRTIARTLTDAGWKRMDPAGPLWGDPPADIPLTPSEGVTIFIPSPDTQTLIGAAQALDEALRKAGIAGSVMREIDPNVRRMVISVQIGFKPQ